MNNSSLVDEFVSEGANILEEIEWRSFVRASALRCTRLDLEIPYEIVCQSREDLPGAVGSVVLGCNGVECETVFEFAKDLFMAASTGHEVPQRFQAEILVGRDG